VPCQVQLSGERPVGANALSKTIRKTRRPLKLPKLKVLLTLPRICFSLTVLSAVAKAAIAAPKRGALDVKQISKAEKLAKRVGCRIGGSGAQLLYNLGRGSSREEA
jgi:hypothetical protein